MTAQEKHTKLYKLIEEIDYAIFNKHGKSDFRFLFYRAFENDELYKELAIAVDTAPNKEQCEKAFEKYVEYFERFFTSYIIKKGIVDLLSVILLKGE